MRPSAALLRAHLRYDFETGELWWRIAFSHRRLDRPVGTPDSKGYLMFKFQGKLYRAHIVAWVIKTGVWPTQQIDHEDTIRTNNRWRNLRQATQSQNNGNGSLNRRNLSGYKGVSKHIFGRWQARIQHEGKQRHLGLFDTPEEANAAYAAEAKRVFGKFARPQG